MIRKSARFYIRSIFVLFLFMFILVQYFKLNLLKNTGALLSQPLTNNSHTEDPQRNYKHLNPRHNAKQTLDLNFTLSKVKHRIKFKYNEQLVLNEMKFGPLEKDTVIIIIQVHRRISYLKHLISSLSKAWGISQALLIFSHDYYDEDINELVQNIDFCKVIQIFYPYSIQIYPDEFPGNHRNDCARNTSKDKAVISNCNSALYPDIYGHYREAKFTQIKHHWWWKANRVFNKLIVTKQHNGLFLFLEEDHYMAEDFLHVLKVMEKDCADSCPNCNVLCLGNYNSKFTQFTYNRKAKCMPWQGGSHNMGLAFNRTTWSNIRKCAQIFCTYDDYNWDWSLEHASEKCMESKLIVMVVRGPRAFHIGNCGIHQNKSDCESNLVLQKVKYILNFASISDQLYPPFLTISKSILDNNEYVIKKAKNTKRNGGWSDPRDHQLCLNMTI